MNKYIVSVVSPRHLRQRMVIDPETGAEFAPIMHYRSLWEVQDYNGNDFTDLENFFFDRKDRADNFAKWLAVEKPGHEIYVSEVQHIICAEVSPAIVKKVTDKGVVPV